MKSAFMVPIYLAVNKIKDRRQREEDWIQQRPGKKALPETREVKLTQGNWQISKIIHVSIYRSCK